MIIRNRRSFYFYITVKKFDSFKDTINNRINGPNGCLAQWQQIILVSAVHIVKFSSFIFWYKTKQFLANSTVSLPDDCFKPQFPFPAPLELSPYLSFPNYHQDHGKKRCSLTKTATLESGTILVI